MTTPYLYQLHGVRGIHKFKGRCLLADEMGLGKSFQSLTYLDRYKEKNLPCLIICPATVKWNWQNECWIHIGMRSLVLEGESPPRKYKLTHDIVIINYDILSSWMKIIQDFKPKLLILDEAQYCASRNSIRSKKVLELSHTIPHIIALSGTPLTNRPAELWPILNILRPELFPSFYPFANRYCSPKKVPWGNGWDYRGSSNLKELHEILTANFMIRRRKIDVLSELPEKSRHVQIVELENFKEYLKAKNDFIKWLSSIDISKATRAMKVEKLVKFGYLKRLVGELKLKSVIEWIKTFLRETDEKLVVFGIHRPVVERIYNTFSSISVLVNGSVIGKNRKVAIDSFEKNKSIRLLVGNIKAAGIGINLVSSSTIMFAELGDNYAQHDQCEARIDRIGQVKKTNSYYLIAKNTIEERLVQLIHRSAKVISTTIDGGVEKETMDIFEELLKSLK